MYYSSVFSFLFFFTYLYCIWVILVRSVRVTGALSWRPRVTVPCCHGAACDCRVVMMLRVTVPQTDEERQQALRPFLGSPGQTAFSSPSSGGSLPPLASPQGLSQSRPRSRKSARKSQNHKYRLKYLRLRRAARAMIFVSHAFHSCPLRRWELRGVQVEKGSESNPSTPWTNQVTSITFNQKWMYSFNVSLALSCEIPMCLGWCDSTYIWHHNFPTPALKFVMNGIVFCFFAPAQCPVTLWPLNPRRTLLCVTMVAHLEEKFVRAKEERRCVDQSEMLPLNNECIDGNASGEMCSKWCNVWRRAYQFEDW